MTASVTGFYARMQQAFEAYAEIGAAFCRQIFMDTAGHRSRR